MVEGGDVEGREARGGVIRPNIPPSERPQWPEAVWLLVQKSRLGYTLEAPSDFEMQVWRALLKTPFAGATTYSDLAAEIGRPKAARAVGAAVAGSFFQRLSPVFADHE